MNAKKVKLIRKTLRENGSYGETQYLKKELTRELIPYVAHTVVLNSCFRKEIQETKKIFNLIQQKHQISRKQIQRILTTPSICNV